MMPAAMIRRHRLAGAHHVVEGGEHALRELRLGHELDGDLGDHDQHALRAGDQRKQVVARRIEREEPISTTSPAMVTPRTAAGCAP